MSSRYKGSILSATAATNSQSAAVGIWRPNEVLQAVNASLWPSGITYDPYFKYVTLLLHGDGTNGAQNNTFLDSSTNNFTITRNGNTTQGTFSPYGANWSNYFGGSQYISVPSNAVFALGTGDFTIEAWIYGSIPTTGYFDICGNCFSSTGLEYFLAIYNGKLRFATWFTSVLSGATNVVSNQWNHVAVCRASGTTRLFLNGVMDGSVADSNSYTSSDAFGVGYSANIYFNGYISNARVVKGTALYTSTFTPSTAPLIAISGTSLLTCQSNRFIDNSTNAFTITINGSPSIQRFSPFSPSAAYSTSVIGGSGYFDGSGDYLSAGAAANWTFLHNGSDWTIQFWVYHTGTSLYGVLSTTAFTAQTGMSVFLNNTGSGGAVNAVQVYITRGDGVSSAAFNSSATLVINAWNYVAITFTSSTKTCAFYINGASAGSSSNTGFSYSASAPSNTLSIGRYDGTLPGGYLTGYLSDIRTANAVLSGVSTAATAPLTTVTNTQLLLSYTNGGIFDNAEMNDLETIGSAQISTAQFKYGTGSMSFNGTTSYLTALDNPNLQMGSGDFTIEGWVFINTASTAYGIVSKGTASTGISVNITSGNKLQFSYTASNLTGATSLVASTWYYFAIVRSGSATGNIKIYLNGSVDATSAGAVTDNFNQTNTLYVGADRVGGSLLNGYIDDLRITKGYARTITTPIQAFPNQ